MSMVLLYATFILSRLSICLHSVVSKYFRLLSETFNTVCDPAVKVYMYVMINNKHFLERLSKPEQQLLRHDLGSFEKEKIHGTTPDQKENKVC